MAFSKNLEIQPGKQSLPGGKEAPGCHRRCLWLHHAAGRRCLCSIGICPRYLGFRLVGLPCGRNSLRCSKQRAESL